MSSTSHHKELLSWERAHPPWVRWAARRPTSLAAAAESMRTTSGRELAHPADTARPPSGDRTTGPRRIDLWGLGVSDKPKHFCGVAGMTLTVDCVSQLRKGLRVIQ